MRPVILTFARNYLPGYKAGGPIRTIANMVASLGDEFEFRIVTLDRDLGDTKPYPGVEGDTWVPCGKAMVRYISQAGFGLGKIVEIARSTPHDVIYLNSFFDPRFTQQVLVNNRLGRLRGRPIVIASRGELSPGALRIKSLKKSVFIRLAKLFRLYDGLTWQASSLREAEDIRREMSGGRVLFRRVAVAENLVVAGDQVFFENSQGVLAKRVRDQVAGHPLRVCVLSRISPMKNLHFSLRMLGEVRVPVRFTIFGPIEDEAYWSACEALIAKLPPHIEVVYEGAVEPEQVVPALMNHDLFLLPTLGENFGHVIHEALRAGLPLLISDQTPWRDLEAKGVGWDLSLTDMGVFVQRIEELSGWPAERHQQAAERAYEIALKVGRSEETLKANRELFLNAIHHAVPADRQKFVQGVNGV